MIKKVLVLLLLFFTQSCYCFGQISENQITSLSWENNILTINAAYKINYAESRLKDPDRLIIDLLNCSLENAIPEKTFKSQLGEHISISELSHNQIRIIFLGSASINRKIYITNNEKTLIVRMARIDAELEEAKVEENTEQTSLEKYTPGKLREITIEEDDGETEVIVSATKSIKYNSYFLKNPARFAIDLLNITPPNTPLPKFNPTMLVSGVRVGRAASGIEATRIVIDLAKENTSSDVSSSLIGNKLRIRFKYNKEQEKALKKSGIKVVIDPGHGGYDTGAGYGGFEEKFINLTISEKLKVNLEIYGITVFLTRDEDSFLSLAERAEITNSIKPDVFISIHVNALNTSRAIRGVETYYWTSQSQKLAYYVQKSILSNVQIPDHFIRRAKFYVVRHTASPAVLAELGFLSNHDDRELLTSLTVQDQYAKALTEAILKFLDIEPKRTETERGRTGEPGKEQGNRKN